MQNVKLLVAEDDELNLLVMREILEEAEIAAEFFDNGRDLVNFVEKHGAADISLVLMDLQMPIMNGFVATARLREIAPDLPVVALTAHAFESERIKTAEVGMVAHLAKPIRPAALVAAIGKYARHTSA